MPESYSRRGTGEGVAQPSDLRDDEFISLAERIIESGKHNCDGLRVPLKSTFNLEVWKKYAHIFQDPRLIEFLTFGFPLSGEDYGSLRRHDIENHESARKFPHQVAEFLRKGTVSGAIAGPFGSMPSKHCHISPLMSREKDDTSRRIILDLSFGGVGESVNGATDRSTYDGVQYNLTLPNLDALIVDVAHMQNPRVFKIDIAKAFMNVRVDPGDALKLTMCHGGKYYVDRSLSFGAVHGTAIFQRITDAVRKILASENIRVYNYIDDIFACAEESVAHEAFRRLEELIGELGLPINRDKVVAPAEEMICMGVEINVRNRTVRLPREKICEIEHACEQFRGRRTCKRRELQSLLGKLLYLAKIIIPARGFLNRMLAYLRNMGQNNTIRLGDSFSKDLAWFQRLLTVMNPEATYAMVDEQDHIDLYVDASLQGLGAH